MGGVSKASKGIHLSEDIFAGFNYVLRGGESTQADYIQVTPHSCLLFVMCVLSRNKVYGDIAPIWTLQDTRSRGEVFSILRLNRRVYCSLRDLISTRRAASSGLQVSKGRDTGVSQVTGFTAKISMGNGMQVKCSWIYRIKTL